MTPRPRRESFGGSVVRDSLSSLGYHVTDPRTSLVETASPTSPLDVLMVQNAWNVVDRRDFLHFSAPYPRRMQARMRARRALAIFNIRRARRVVCLSTAVAELTAANTGVDAIVVAPATLPIHDWSASKSPHDEPDNGYALVVGTVTWYKRPMLALECIAKSFPEVRSVLFLGSDDGSGAWDELQSRASLMGIGVRRQVVRHADVYKEYRRCSVAVVPSAMESLGFALAEALVHAPAVVASALPAHQEVADRVGVEPTWIGGPSGVSGTDCRFGAKPIIDFDTARNEWMGVANAMGLT